MTLKLLANLPEQVRNLVYALVEQGEIALISTQQGDYVDWTDLDPYKCCDDEE